MTTQLFWPSLTMREGCRGIKSKLLSTRRTGMAGRIISAIKSILWKMVISIVLVSVSMHGQTTGSSQSSPEGIVQIFCTMDAQGKQLTPQGQKEVDPLLAQQKAWVLNPEITIIKDFVVRGPTSGADATLVAVAYNVWGKLDSSLRFTPLSGPVANRPTLVPESFNLNRLNTHTEPGPGGQLHEVMEHTEWRINKPQSEPHIDLEAAIRYVRESSYRSRDPLLRMNAQRTLAALMSIYRMQSFPAPYHQ